MYNSINYEKILLQFMIILNIVKYQSMDDK